ncbi:hypothetical protein EON63_08730 [archaeon]|nr:MAG: hypothetical protein EON63_08730 [archaeon]
MDRMILFTIQLNHSYNPLQHSPSLQCLPVTLDVGTNTHSVLNDPSYIGVRAARERGPAYDKLVDGFMTGAQEVFGRNVLIQVWCMLWCVGMVFGMRWMVYGGRYMMNMWHV